jgi:hypothetical protein
MFEAKLDTGKFDAADTAESENKIRTGAMASCSIQTSSYIEHAVR